MTSYPPLERLRKIPISSNTIFMGVMARAEKKDIIWKKVFREGFYGVELKKKGDLACVLMADPSEPGRFRAVFHNESCLLGHATRDTQEEVVEMVLQEGYTELCHGLLDKRCALWRCA